MAIFGVVILLWNTFQGGKTTQKELTFSEFTSAVKSGEISEVTIRGKQLTGKFSGRSTAGESRYGAGEFKTQLPDYPDLVKDLQTSNVQIKAEEPRENPLLAVLLTWAPVLLIVGLWIFFMPQMQSGGNRGRPCGKTKASLL